MTCNVVSSSQEALVMRDGEWISVQAALVVQGDIVEIKGGDRIPADVRIIESRSLKVGKESGKEYLLSSITNRRGISPCQNEASHIWSFSYTYKMCLLEDTKWWRCIA